MKAGDNNLVHFAIHADDLQRAREFYARVFGWRFETFGGEDMSGFCKIKNAAGEEPGLIGAMQHRRFNVLPQRVHGFECTVGVDDVDATLKAVEASGGKVLMPKAPIPGVGWLGKFADTEGNLVCVIRFDEAAK
jgi:predicted enzyme related to lactoylglutathione lyase